MEELTKIVAEFGWRELPDVVVTREGDKLDTTSDEWHLPYILRSDSTLDFNKIHDVRIKWVLKRYVIDKIERVSTHAGYSVFEDVWREFVRRLDKPFSADDEEFREELISLIEKSISVAREEHRLYALYRSIQWYIWCAEHYPELGFCPAYAMELDGMVVPGNPKGEAVRAEDPDRGPLHRSLELPLLINAMQGDRSVEFKHLQEKTAMALSIALGRNPANLTYLLEEDIFDLTPEGDDRCYVIRMPRIKKRQINPRDDFLEEYIEPEFARYLLELIENNRAIETIIEHDGKNVELPKPLFINVNKNKAAVVSGKWKNTYNMVSKNISSLLKSFVKRHNIISPITKELINISTRRLRYTLATNLAAEGISKKELARILDHTDTQHVLVYFEMAGKIIEHLDKAAAKSFSKYLSFFKGNIIKDDSEAINGDRDDKHLNFVNESDPKDQIDIGVCGEGNICHLDPPFSCYMCAKFQPYDDANHEHVLDCLLEDRESRLKKYESSRLGIQLDDVIMAVAQVVEMCKKEPVNV